MIRFVPAAHAQTDTRAVPERFVLDFLGQGNPEAAEAVIAPEVVAITGLSPAAPIEGRDAYVETFLAVAAAFPFETPIEIVDSFVTEDRAMMRIRARATHTGGVLGLRAANRSILFDETRVMRIEDGMVTQNVGSASDLEFEMVFAPVLAPLVLGEEAPCRQKRNAQSSSLPQALRWGSQWAGASPAAGIPRR